MKKLFTDPITAKCIKPFDGLGLKTGDIAKIEPNIGNKNEYDEYIINGAALVSKETVLEFFNINYTFDFGQAIKHMKDGKKVARIGWNGKGLFIFLVSGSTFKVNRPPLLGIYEEGTEINYQPHVDMKTADGTIVPWLCSQSDMLAEDWEVVE